jgi:hypothetical protein
MLWISWLVEYKPLFFTTNNNTENIYWDCKGRISNLLNTVCGPGSSVGIATSYGLDGPGIESQ